MHARGLQYFVCLCVCVFSLFWHLVQSGVQTAVSATSARYGHQIKKGIFLKKRFVPKLWHHLLTVTVPGDIQAPLSLLFQRRSILKLFKRLTVGYALPGTPLDIRQKARVLWQSLSLLSQCSEHVTIPHNFCICVRARHGYTDVVFIPPTYCRLLASSTHFIIMPGLNERGLQSKLLITPLSEY